MKYLYLMRHAKSSWKDKMLSDFARPLNKRGKKDAPQMAKVLSEFDHPPELIVTSPAIRAAETAKFVQRLTFFKDIPYVEKERLYAANSNTILDVIREQPDAYQALLVIGHNPGIEDLASELCAGEDYIRMPTAALVQLFFKVKRWQEIDMKKGMLEALVYPRTVA
ncbi:MAG: histidine phosphatase family protein [Candidatus Tectomicrobia bacterium]|nr:histidine phosphatase family protein [Candidatus Tectomicrobia bacterium]